MKDFLLRCLIFAVVWLPVNALAHWLIGNDILSWVIASVIATCLMIAVWRRYSHV